MNNSLICIGVFITQKMPEASVDWASMLHVRGGTSSHLLKPPPQCSLAAMHYNKHQLLPPPPPILLHCSQTHVIYIFISGSM